MYDLRFLIDSLTKKGLKCRVFLSTGLEQQKALEPRFGVSNLVKQREPNDYTN